MVLVIGQGLKVVIDEGFARGEERLLDTTLATLAGLIGALGVLTWIRVYNVYWLGARFTADLRRRVYGHLLTLSPGFFEETRTGEVSSRVTNDVTLIEAVMGGTAWVTGSIVAPGVVRQTGTYQRMTFGELDGAPSARGRATGSTSSACRS